jgi:hypothetical protein
MRGEGAVFLKMFNLPGLEDIARNTEHKSLWTKLMNAEHLAKLKKSGEHLTKQKNSRQQLTLLKKFS